MGKVCVVCKEDKGPDDYSKKQWKAGNAVRKCKACITAKINEIKDK